MKRIDRSAIVEHSAAQIFALVEDIEAYPRFLPWCVAATVDERGPAGTRATLTVGVRGLRQSFTTLNRSRPGKAIDLSLVQGPFRRFAAAWRFTPLSERASRTGFSNRQPTRAFFPGASPPRSTSADRPERAPPSRSVCGACASRSPP